MNHELLTTHFPHIPDNGRIIIYGNRWYGSSELRDDLRYVLDRIGNNSEVINVMQLKNIEKSFFYKNDDDQEKDIKTPPDGVIVLEYMRGYSDDGRGFDIPMFKPFSKGFTMYGEIKSICDDNNVPINAIYGRYTRQFTQQTTHQKPKDTNQSVSYSSILEEASHTNPLASAKSFSPRRLFSKLLERFRVS